MIRTSASHLLQIAFSRDRSPKEGSIINLINKLLSLDMKTSINCLRLFFFFSFSKLKWEKTKFVQNSMLLETETGETQVQYGYNVWPLLLVPLRFQLCAEHDIVIHRKKKSREWLAVWKKLLLLKMRHNGGQKPLTSGILHVPCWLLSGKHIILWQVLKSYIRYSPDWRSNSRRMLSDSNMLNFKHFSS